MIEVLKKESNVDWENLPATYRYGSIVTREPTAIKLGVETLSKIPVDKRPKNDTVMRNVFVENQADEYAKHTLENRVKYVKEGV